MKQTFEYIGNLVLVMTAAIFGTIIGAVVTWIPGYYLLSLIFPPITDPMRASEECARGGALGLLAIIVGGIVGCIISFIATVKSIRANSNVNSMASNDAA